jgi:molecular chaperone DnaK
MSYGVGVDLGASQCAAAACLPGPNTRPKIVPLATDSLYLPSIVFANPDGSWLVGEDAQRMALREPSRVARRFKRRIGDGTPLLVGGTPVPAEVLAARLIAGVVDTVAERERGAASGVAVTHPASWGTHRLTSLRTALATHGLDHVRYLSEPEAAALAHDTRERVAPGRAIAVYDLGGAGFEATVVRKLGDERFTLAGRPEEIELGGLDFDEVVFEHVQASLGAAWDELDPGDPAVLAAAMRLRRECTLAKEALSADTDVLIKVSLPGIDTQIRLARAEFEELIRPAVDETVAALVRALRSAEIAPQELAAVLLVGGSARIPLVTQAVSEQLGRPVSVGADPKGIVAIGAALAARVPEPEPTRVGVWPVQAPAVDPASDPLLRSLPSFGPPPVAKPVGLMGRLPRTVAISGAAAVLTAVAVFGGITYLADRTGPPDADAVTTTRTTQATPTEEPTEEPVATTEPPAPRTTTTRAPRRTTNPPRTTKTTPKTTTTTTTAPTTTTTAPTTTTPASPR